MTICKVRSSLAVALLALLCSAGNAVAQTEPPGTEALFEISLPIPAHRSEITPPRPSDEHAWVPGYWDRSPGKWSWVAGAWKVPPFAGAYWMRGHWRYGANEWVWTRGYWAVGDTPHVVDTPIEPPAPPRDVKPAPPTEATDWLPGHWEWSGAWQWRLGRWATRPHPEAVWEVGRWEPVDGEGLWRWRAAHWNVPD